MTCRELGRDNIGSVHVVLWGGFLLLFLLFMGRAGVLALKIHLQGWESISHYNSIFEME